MEDVSKEIAICDEQMFEARKAIHDELDKSIPCDTYLKEKLDLYRKYTLRMSYLKRL